MRSSPFSFGAGRFGMRSASSGLRHPASASCLGRHLRLAGRCPNNSSLFPPLAAVVVVALWEYSAENYFLFRVCRALRSAPNAIFTERGRNPKLHLQRRFLRKRGAAGERLLPLGGAVAQRLRGFKWRSEKSVKAIAPTGAALAFLCFDFFFRIVKGEQPLARCGVGGVQR